MTATDDPQLATRPVLLHGPDGLDTHIRIIVGGNHDRSIWTPWPEQYFEGHRGDRRDRGDTFRTVGTSEVANLNEEGEKNR